MIDYTIGGAVTAIKLTLISSKKKRHQAIEERYFYSALFFYFISIFYI